MSAPPPGQVPTFKLILVGDGGTGARRDATRRARGEGARDAIERRESETANRRRKTRATGGAEARARDGDEGDDGDARRG